MPIRPRKVYLDRNVLSNLRLLARGSGNDNAFTQVNSLVNERRIEILLSYTLIEETLQAVKATPGVLREDVKIISDLVNYRRVIKPPLKLLREAIESYALGRQQYDMRTRTDRTVKELFESRRASFDIKHFVDLVDKDNEEFIKDYEEGFAKAQKAGIEKNVVKPNDCSEFWNEVALNHLEWRAKGFGYHKECDERGFEGLLNIRVLRLYSIYYASWVFAKWFGEQGVPGRVESSEKGDFFHAVQSAAADIFVTEDKRLRRWLEQIPVEGFKVVGLKEFVGEVI